ncbi:MAG TPA: ABC transporter substrate-binding protein [Candidatus Binataceae bacterium]|nr:ABC transporter substrate-binding protein [Candidatus Binataceae bacterium]
MGPMSMDNGPPGRNRIAGGALIVAAALMWAALATTGCERRRIGVPDGYLQVDLESSPLTLDPRYATDALSERVDHLVFDSLVRIDEHGRFVGNLAESFERPAPTKIVFHLRGGLRFSDGRALTARDVKYSYDSVLDPAATSPKLGGLGPIAAIEAPDDRTIVITTHRPYAPALELAMMGVVPYGTPARGGTPVGSGPFRIESFVRDDAVVLGRNPQRPSGPGAPRGIVFKVVPDPTVRALELAEGVCDLSENNIQPDLLGYLAMRPNLRIVESPGTTYHYLEFNFRNPKLRDLRVRTAIALGIDRRAIIKALMRDTARPATGMIAPENWAYSGDAPRYEYDPVEASKLLDEAGWPRDESGMRDISLMYKTTPEGKRLAEAISAMLLRMGINVMVRTNEFATFYGDIERGDFDLAALDWVGINDPHHYYMVFDSAMTPPRGYNRGDYSNPKMDELLEAGDATIDQEQRREIYAQVQKLAATDLPYVSMWWQDNVVVMNRNIRGFKPFPNGSLRSLENVTVEAQTK